MDIQALNQTFAYASQTCAGIGIALRLASTFYPDARRIRLLRIPSLLFGAASYQLVGGQTAGAAMMGLGAARSGIRATPRGAKHRNALSAISVGLMSYITFRTYEDLIDALPLGISVLGTGADYTAQGRYQRLIITIAGVSAIAYSMQKGNHAMTISNAVSTTLSCLAMYKYDIKNAAGLEKPHLTKDLRSYCHGIRHDAATGAGRKGQVAVGETGLSIEEMYQIKLQEKPNPHFVTQQAARSDSLRL